MYKAEMVYNSGFQFLRYIYIVIILNHFAHKHYQSIRKTSQQINNELNPSCVDMMTKQMRSWFREGSIASR